MPDDVPPPEKSEQSGRGNLLTTTLRTATRYLNTLKYYLLAVAAAAATFAALVANYGALGMWASIGVGALGVLPLLLAFFCEALPGWRKGRRQQRLKAWAAEGETPPGYFRIGPYEDSHADRQRYRRADDAHAKVLEWIQTSSQPLLFLTGRSGTGKSSLLNAHVIPKLREASPAVHTITLRSFDDPVRALRQRLLEPGNVFKRVPKGVQQLETIDLLGKAADYLSKEDRRLLVVLDQFEELVIIHGQHPEQVEPIRELLRSLHEAPIAGLTVLVSLRSDYQPMLARLGLPILEQGRNWWEIGPFTERASRDFLEGSGLELGPKRLDSVLAEAAAVEETRGLIRPITLNTLGTLLDRLPGDVPAPDEPGNLIARDLRRCLDATNVRDHARTVLGPLLTDAGTKRPRAVGELSRQTGLDTYTIEGCLAQLSVWGLVRRINRADEIAARVWEISHDFVARLLDQILHTPRKSRWQRLRPVLTPASLALWAIVACVVVPMYIADSKTRTVAMLERVYRVQVQQPARGDPEASCYVVDIPDEFRGTLTEIEPLIKRLEDYRVTIHGRQVIASEQGAPKGFADARTLDFTGANLGDAGLVHVKGLTGLKTLDLTGSFLGDPQISDAGLVHLKGLTGLQTLVLRDTRISDAGLEHLKGLTGLQTLDLSSNFQISDAALVHLKELKNLEVLIVEFTGISDAGVYDLKEALPQLTIRR